MKPTYGLVSDCRLLLLPLDQIGPFGRTVEDTAILIKRDRWLRSCKDSTSLRFRLHYPQTDLIKWSTGSY